MTRRDVFVAAVIAAGILAVAAAAEAGIWVMEHTPQAVPLVLSYGLVVGGAVVAIRLWKGTPT
jgi:hypothetical protein